MSTGLSRRHFIGAGTTVVAGATLTDFGGAGSALAGRRRLADEDVQLTHDSQGFRVENTPGVRDRLAMVHESRLPVRHLTVPPALASDDVSVLAQASKSSAVYWFVGSGEPGRRLGPVGPACHTDAYLPHRATLAVATAAMREALPAGLAGDLDAD